MVGLSEVAARYRRLAMLGAATVAAVPFLYNLNTVIGQVVEHFGLSYSTAFVVVSLVVEGSWWISVVFPYIIPVEVTVEILAAVLGIGYAVGW